jgi:hypothetical protein
MKKPLKIKRKRQIKSFDIHLSQGDAPRSENKVREGLPECIDPDTAIAPDHPTKTPPTLSAREIINLLKNQRENAF